MQTLIKNGDTVTHIARPPQSGTSSRYSLGVVNGVAAQTLGALGFIIPSALTGFTATELTLGRYLAYGFLSLCALLVTFRHGLRRLDSRSWRTAFIFAAIANIGYYFILVLGILFVGPAVAALIVGTLPVTVALYGNWKRHEYPFTRLALPVVLILAGLVLINLPGSHPGPTSESRSMGIYLVGLLCTLAALSLWTWFAVANATFLEEHPRISAPTWTSVVGVNTLILSLAATALLATAYHAQIGPSVPPLPLSPQRLPVFVVGSVALGLGASWGATSLWNRACVLLPISLAGQLIVCEPLTVLLFVFLAHRHLPSLLEFTGIVLTLGGVLLSLKSMGDRDVRSQTHTRHTGSISGGNSVG